MTLWVILFFGYWVASTGPAWDERRARKRQLLDWPLARILRTRKKPLRFLSEVRAASPRSR